MLKSDYLSDFGMFDIARLINIGDNNLYFLIK